MARRSASERKIKYVGDADVRRLLAGEDFGGRLGEPLDEDLEWSWDNNHLLTTSVLSDDAMKLLLEDPDFVDVTDASTIPVAAVAKRRRAAQDHDATSGVVDLNSASQGALNRAGTAASPGSISTGDTGGDAGQGESTSSTT